MELHNNLLERHETCSNSILLHCNIPFPSLLKRYILSLNLTSRLDRLLGRRRVLGSGSRNTVSLADSLTVILSTVAGLSRCRTLTRPPGNSGWGSRDQGTRNVRNDNISLRRRCILEGILLVVSFEPRAWSFAGALNKRRLRRSHTRGFRAVVRGVAFGRGITPPARELPQGIRD